MTEKETIAELYFLMEKLYNGIYGDRLGCMYEAVKALKEIQEYRKMGTLEECRAAVEKQRSKKPDYEGDGCDRDGNIIYDTWICPCCGERYEMDYDRYEYCPKCGQAIDRSEES